MIPARPITALGPKIQALIERKCGQRQICAVARRARMNPRHLDQIVQGRRNPRLDTLNRILEAIPAGADELFVN
jgi:transcriptional regulator with XRE-family HTH domain